MTKTYINLAGVTFLQENLKQLLGSKKKIIRFTAEPENKFDSNAVKVEAEFNEEEWKHIGYIPKEYNEGFMEFLANGYLFNPKIEWIGKYKEAEINPICVKISIENKE